MINKKLRQRVFERDGFKCHYCGKKLEPPLLQIDRKHPIIRGGTNDIDNLVTACPACNIKGDVGD